jgi:hypothetical protein
MSAAILTLWVLGGVVERRYTSPYCWIKFQNPPAGDACPR